MQPRRPESGATRSFDQRYTALETRRAALVERLLKLDEKTRLHAGYRNARKLLNDSFRKAKLAQRVAVIESATWLIEILERLPPSL